jgi:hypothetical protein
MQIMTPRMQNIGFRTKFSSADVHWNDILHKYALSVNLIKPQKSTKQLIYCYIVYHVRGRSNLFFFFKLFFLPL